MRILGTIRTWLFAAGAALVAGLFLWSRMLSNRLEERDREIQQQQGYIDTRKRVDAGDSLTTPEDAMQWLKERQGEE